MEVITIVAQSVWPCRNDFIFKRNSAKINYIYVGRILKTVLIVDGAKRKAYSNLQSCVEDIFCSNMYS